MGNESFVDAESGGESPDLGRAQELFFRYHLRLNAVTGDRPAIQMIRDDLRSDEEFWELSQLVYEIVEGKPDWISAVFRAESKRATRQYAGRMEEIRREREERRLAEQAAERAEMEQLNNFGMF